MQGLVVKVVAFLALASYGNAMMVGAYRKQSEPTDMELIIAAYVRPQVQAAVEAHCQSNCLDWAPYCDRKPFNEYKLEEVWSQVVAGTNYLFKIDVGKNRFIGAKVFNPLPLLTRGELPHPVLKCVKIVRRGEELLPSMCESKEGK